MEIYTIGHSNHSLEKLVFLLNQHGVVNLVDVRSAPYSRYNPHFNKDSLNFELPRHNFNYIFAGKYLGGRPNDPSLYKNQTMPDEGVDYLQEVDYSAIMKRKWFIQAISQLLEIARQDVTAIMCSEEDPADCHRHHLIARYLMANCPEVAVIHIRKDGKTYGAHTILKSVNEPKATQRTMF